MRNTKYEYLKKRYPEFISLDQLYRICSISKRSASYLIMNGIIPSTDTGKKTWRYRIAVKDVVIYLQKREKLGSMIPTGAASLRHKNPANPRKSFADIVEKGAEVELGEYFKYIHADYPDVLDVADVAEMTGLSNETILRHLRSGKIKSIMATNKYLIPKIYVSEYVISHDYIDCKSNSNDFKRIIQGFMIWKSKATGGKK